MLSFNDVIGQSDVKKHLMLASSSDMPSHAYILCGDPGSGKKMLAKRFAAALQCTGEGSRPCGGCISCMQAESDNHPDIIYVTHEKAAITVDDIRHQVIGDISIKPYSGQYKIYIIDEADKMNEAAQNAILKTLEEPPAYSVLLLLACSTGPFLQTILSRCVILQLKPVETSLIRSYLINEHRIPDYMAKLCASFSCGSIGAAVKIATDETFATVKDSVISLVTRIGDMNLADISEAIAGFGTDKEHKKTVSDYFDLIRLWYRDVLVYKSTGNSERIMFSENLSDIAEDASRRSYENLNRINLAIDKAAARLNANVHLETTLELMLLAMKETK